VLARESAPPSPAADRLVLDEPPRMRAAPVAVSLPEPRRRAPAYAAGVTYEPVRPHLLRRAVNRIPGLRRLQKSYKDGEKFNAARPLRQVAPTVPAGLTPAIAQLDLKISIDESGRVAETKVISDEWDQRLESPATAAASKWEFAPARLNDKPVRSEMILHFDFAPPRNASR
jgi:hypothetical protein